MMRLLRYVLMMLLSLCLAHAPAQTKLGPTEFEKAITNADTVQVLDVRTHAEYNNSHIKNALLADWRDQAEFSRRIGFIDKNRPVYVYCLGGSRSAEAAEKMRASGYSKVYELTGGINAWKAEGKPVEKSSIEKQMSVEEFAGAIKVPGMVLVDFGTTWCPPCKKMEPVLKNLLERNPGKFSLLKVDGDRDRELLKKFEVTALPVFILFKEGKQVWRKEGIFSEDEFVPLLK
jgi:rhodanese-related sulfurtransferase